MNLPLGRFFYSFRETDMIYRIALLQMNVVMSDFKTNFDKAKHLIEKAAQQKVDIVVLPEMWNVGFFPKEKLHNLADYQGQHTLNLLTQLAKKHQVHIIGGTVAVTDGKYLYNRAYCINRSGECAAVYDKIHRFSPSGEHKQFERGKNPVSFTLGNLRAGIATCYDIRFPELIRKLALQHIDILFVVAAWPNLRKNHWNILNRARAIENQIFVCAVNQVGKSGENILAGNSMLLDPLGNYIAQGTQQEEIIIGNIDTDQLNTVRQLIPVYEDRVKGIDTL
jgi:hypothetical protein